LDNNKDIDLDDDLHDFGEEQDFVAPNLDDLEEKTQEKEEEILVPNFEEDTQSLEEKIAKTGEEGGSIFQMKESFQDNIEEDFKDLNKEETPETQEQSTEETSEEKTQETNEEEQTEQEPEKTPEEIEEENRQLELQRKFEENSQNLETWEELNSENDIVKKYIVYVDKENIQAIDELSVDERNAFINSAIKLKFENNDIEKVKSKRKRVIAHMVVMIATAILFMPFAIYLAHMSIVATFKNYKYSQDNFEKLYRESFSKSPTYQKAQKYIKYK
jgi:hypothetical protein